MVQEHDPYGKMLKDAKKGIRPSLPGDKSREKENKAKQDTASKSAKAELADAEMGASGGLYKNGASVKEQEEQAGGFRSSVTGMKEQKKKGLLSGKSKFVKASAGILIFLVLLLIVPIVTFGSPIFQIGHLDFNLQDALGFTKTSGILQKQATRIIAEKLAKGEMPSVLAGDLAEHGINVGQVTANGDFVRTNTYIADIDKLKDVATLGHYEVKPAEGELAVLYDGQVIMADSFVNTVESNMKMFADYTEALDISARYYYSDDVDKVFSAMGLNRGFASGWVDTGDPEKNREKFEELMEQALDNSSSLVMTAFYGDLTSSTSKVRSNNNLISPAPTTTPPDEIYTDPSTGKPVNSDGKPIYIPSQSTTDVTGDSEPTSTGTTTEKEGLYLEYTVSGGDSAESIIEGVSENVKGDEATSKASQLLNAAISAGEPYLAASAFIGIESPIQQARIDGSGPVNELMNMLNKETKIEYRNIATDESVAVTHSILTTPNFVAAVSGGDFSKQEALNFARDRANVATGMSNDEIITGTTAVSDGQDKSKVLLSASEGNTASADELMVLSDSVSMAMVDTNYSLLPGQVGGNRIVEGGSFLSNTINSHVIGAMASDETTIAAYNREARTEVARMAAAEKATKNPFDISSPHTFLGSIAHGFANAMIQSHSSGSGVVSSSIGTIAHLTNDSVVGLWGTATADGEDETDYGTTYGDYCSTVQAINAEGDIYCTAHGAISTGYMNNTEDDWNSEMSNYLKENEQGEMVIDMESDLGEFIQNGMERWTTVGVMNAAVCEDWKDRHGSVGTKIGDFFANVVGMYEACGGVGGDDEALKQAATGAYYSFVNTNGDAEKMKEFGGYVLYDKVSSMLDGTVSKVGQFKEKYYQEHPLDNSRAGVIARISGMTKHEAEVALAYADYLTFIAKYNPAERYAFGVDLMPPESNEPLVEHASQVAVDLYVMWHGRTEYEDLRTRTRVA